MLFSFNFNIHSSYYFFLMYFFFLVFPLRSQTTKKQRGFLMINQSDIKSDILGEDLQFYVTLQCFTVEPPEGTIRPVSKCQDPVWGAQLNPAISNSGGKRKIWFKPVISNSQGNDFRADVREMVLNLKQGVIQNNRVRINGFQLYLQLIQSYQREVIVNLYLGGSTMHRIATSYGMTQVSYRVQKQCFRLGETTILTK